MKKTKVTMIAILVFFGFSLLVTIFNIPYFLDIIPKDFYLRKTILSIAKETIPLKNSILKID